MPEQPDFAAELARLAPEVDETAARELFERRRRPHPAPRWMMPAAAMVLIVAGVVGLAVVTADDADAPSAPHPSTGASPVTLTPTDVVVALPPVGEPTLHNTSIGMFYVVQHDGGDVSVLPATIDRQTSEDEGVTMLQRFVVASESGGSFFSDGDVWDAWGRAATAGRSSDLIGYAGQVVGDQVEVLHSDATRIEGDPEVPDDEDYPLPPRPPFEAITPAQFATLSSSGPAWRLFDAELVVEDGLGRICEVDTTVPLDELDVCDESGVVIDTLVRGTDPDITTWYEAPILAFQDPVRGFTNVIPLAGTSRRDDTARERSDDALVTSIEIVCGGPEETLLLARVGLDLPPGATRTLTIVDGDRELGRASTFGSGPTTVGFVVDPPPSESAELIVTDGTQELTRRSVPAPPDASCTAACASAGPPPFLPSGELAGDPVEVVRDGVSMIVWGDDESGDAVRLLPDEEREPFPLPNDSPQQVTNGSETIRVVPIGDPPVSQIALDLLDSSSCVHHYVIGPGIELDDAIDFAQRWVDALE